MGGERVDEGVHVWQPAAEAVVVIGLLALVQLALWTLTLGWGGASDLGLLWRMGALSVADTPSQPWRLLSSTWLHGSWEHIVGNLIALTVNSVLLVRALGWDRFLLLYLGAGAAGGIVSLLAEQHALVVGSSGAVFGLLGATAVYGLVPRGVLHEGEVVAVREALLPLVALQLLFSFLPGVSWGSHLGGFLFGAMIAGSGLLHLGLPRRATGHPAHRLRWSWTIGVTLLVLVLSCCMPGLLLLPTIVYIGGVAITGIAGPPWRPRLHNGLMLAALGALAVHLGAVGTALAVGKPWLGDVDWVDVELPGGLAPVRLPASMAEPSVFPSSDGERVAFGEAAGAPLTLALDLHAPPPSVTALADGIDGRVPVGLVHGDRCALLEWESADAAGAWVLTGSHLIAVTVTAEAHLPPGWPTAQGAIQPAVLAARCTSPVRATPDDWRALDAAVARNRAIDRRIDQAVRDAPDALGPRLDRADALIRGGRCVDAEGELGTLAVVHPEHARIWRLRARAALDCDATAPTDAVAHAQRAVALAPDAAGLEVLGDALVAAGDTDAAVDAFRRAVPLAPDEATRARLTRRAEGAARGVRVRRGLRR